MIMKQYLVEDFNDETKNKRTSVAEGGDRTSGSVTTSHPSLHRIRFPTVVLYLEEPFDPKTVARHENQVLIESFSFCCKHQSKVLNFCIEFESRYSETCQVLEYNCTESDDDKQTYRLMYSSIRAETRLLFLDR